ncbi:MAG: LytTR family DNA-binding domain-containing protein [Wenzhouxiangella sp.]
MKSRSTGRLFKVLVTAPGRLWSRPIAFERDWRLPLGLGLALGLLVVFVILFLEPWGTERYQAPWRALRLSGYGLCVLLAVLLVHGLDLLRLDRLQRRGFHWGLGDQVVSTLVMVALVSAMTYLYNTLAVNLTAASWGGLLDWTVHIVAPVLVLAVAPLFLLRRRLIRAIERRRQAAASITVVGRNREDRVRMPRGGFVCAEAQQNYVVLRYLDQTEPRDRMIRATLAELEQQLPDAMRVHRSWLINPRRAQARLGNARSRRLRLDGFAGEVPVSPGFDLRLLDVASD